MIDQHLRDNEHRHPTSLELYAADERARFRSQGRSNLSRSWYATDTEKAPRSVLADENSFLRPDGSAHLVDDILNSHRRGRDRNRRRLRTELYRSDTNLCMSVSCVNRPASPAPLRKKHERHRDGRRVHAVVMLRALGYRPRMR